MIQHKAFTTEINCHKYLAMNKAATLRENIKNETMTLSKDLLLTVHSSNIQTANYYAKKYRGICEITFVQYRVYFAAACKYNPRVKINCCIPEHTEHIKYFKSVDGISYLNTDTGYMGGLCRFKDGTENLSKLHQEHRIALGGNQIDCYASNLVNLYKKQGFVEYQRIPFNEKYAPKNWQSDLFLCDKPDVVFMRLKRG